MRLVAAIAALITKHHGRRARNSAVTVARVRRLGSVASQPVYDLTVEKDGCYIANGILVSNSDAFGEFAVNCSLRLPEAPKIVQPNKLVFEAQPNGAIRSNMTMNDIIRRMERQRKARR